jgi:hypothetical protein
MLISWIVLAIGQLSDASLPVIDLGSNLPRPITAPVTPGEPSTLVEAIIGAAIIVVYLTLMRRIRGGRSMPRISKPTRARTGRKAA